MIRIGEFAAFNNVTPKMLRHYDEIGLFRPVRIDPQTGYRMYSDEQSKLLNWITLLKELDFSLNEIKCILEEPVETRDFLKKLKEKRITISSRLNDQLIKRMQISRLIKLIESEGFRLDQNIDLLSVTDKDVKDIMKSIPNMESFIEKIKEMHEPCEDGNESFFIRTDLWNFKEVNDTYGYEAGDRAISWFYEMLRAAAGTYCEKYAMARAGGDEFIVFAFGDQEKALKVVRELTGMIDSIDLKTTGLPCRVQCYIGILTTKASSQRWREALGYTYEAIYAAREKGANSYEIIELPD